MKNLSLHFLLFFSAIVNLQATTNTAVVGYLPSYRWNTINQIDYTALTHIMVSFANPNVNGEFSFNQNLTNLKTHVTTHDIKLFISIGGGALTAEQQTVYMEFTQLETRTQFIHQLMNYVRTNEFDGVDVDLEGDLVLMDSYNDYVQELGDSLHAAGLEMSAALTRWTAQNGIQNSTLEKMDFINLMAYDATGPWQPSQGGQHSSMQFAQDQFNYFNNRVTILR